MKSTCTTLPLKLQRATSQATPRLHVSSVIQRVVLYIVGCASVKECRNVRNDLRPMQERVFYVCICMRCRAVYDRASSLCSHCYDMICFDGTYHVPMKRSRSLVKSEPCRAESRQHETQAADRSRSAWSSQPVGQTPPAAPCPCGHWPNPASCFVQALAQQALAQLAVIPKGRLK